MSATLEVLAALPRSGVAVRSLHFLALAVLLGGSATIALLDRPSPTLARRYEYAFWIGIGIIVATGVGNVGMLAPAVPDLETTWGRTFAVKVIAVIGLLLFSMIRTGRIGDGAGDALPDRRWYALTAGWVAVIAVLAVVMARG